MPTKSKKSIKTPNSNLKSSPNLQPNIKNHHENTSNLLQDELHEILEQASSKFPSFISKTSLICNVSEFESSYHQKGCRIWLSEASLLSSSISPASLVSVSLALLGGNSRSDFPLSSLADECSEQFGLDREGEMDDKAGKFFVLATVFPSNKLVKNGVRISSNLSYSLGRPTIGRVVFVHPIHYGSLNSLVQGNAKLGSSYLSHPLLCHCKELYIRLLPLKTLSLHLEASSPSKSCPGKALTQYENGDISSPGTPSLNHSRPCSPSPIKSSLLSSEDSIPGEMDTKRSYIDSVEIKELLGDENAKKLLEHTAVSWLYSRFLLRGNLVTVPVLSRLCLFEVVGTKSLSADEPNDDPTHTSRLVHCTDEAFIIDRSTKINICIESDLASNMPEERISTPGMRYGDINLKVRDEVTKLGGLQKEYTLLRDIISSSVKNALSSLGLRTTKGVLLYGPPGTGKTCLAQLCAHDAGVSLFKVNGPEIVSQYYGESEQALSDVFKSASDAAPSVIFIDELDAIAPARKEGGDELSQRMVATLLNLMDGISRTDGLLIVAATNRVECIEPALRRPGRLDREIEIGVPSPDQRLDILTTLLDMMEHNLSVAQIQQLAVVTHGFVGADLAALSNEAAMVCLRRSIDCGKYKKALSSDSSVCNGSDDTMDNSLVSRNGDELLLNDCSGSPSSAITELAPSFNSICGETTFTHDSKEEAIISYEATSTTQEKIMSVTFDDFERARMRIRPSAMREVILEVPKVKWEDVGGQQEVKAQLMEAVEWPQKHQHALKRIGVRPPTGVLMFGPPGCSKTLMARAVASEAGLNFLAVKGPELFSKWVGESEKAVRSLFAKARANAPSIIFFDEIDSLAVIRGKESDGVSVADRVMSQLLVELDGMRERVNVTVIAATNRPDKIDPALLRPGRFDRLLYVGPPNENDRIDIFCIHLRKMPCRPDVNLTELARLSKGCTGADISLVCREAAISAIEDNLAASEISMEHLKHAILRARPSEIQSYQELSEKFQRVVYSKTQSDDSLCYCQPSKPDSISTWNPVKLISQLGYWLAAVLTRQGTFPKT